jgi:hypothetical protein
VLIFGSVQFAKQILAVACLDLGFVYLVQVSFHKDPNGVFIFRLKRNYKNYELSLRGFA